MSEHALRPDHPASKAAVIATAGIFGLTYSLSAALIALDLAEMGLGEGLIGANAAMHAVGVLGMVFVLPRLTAAWGLRRVMLGALLASAALLMAFPAMPVFWLWFPLRLLLGAASETLFVLSETWLNGLSSETTRARTMGVYTAVMSLGFALGPLILVGVGADGFLPYLTGGGLAVLAALCVLAPGIRVPGIDAPGRGGALAYLQLAPLALAATALNAAVETSGLTFLPLYALSLGWAENRAAGLMSVIMFGAIVLQPPIGWLGDKVDRRRLVRALAGIAAIGALIWPWALSSPAVACVLLFVWGGAFVGIYTIMLAVVGNRFQGGELIGIYAAMGLLWGAGALLGPVLAGAAMQGASHGLPLFVALACTAFMAMAARLKT